jgi:hypothetical protein
MQPLPGLCSRASIPVYAELLEMPAAANLRRPTANLLWHRLRRHRTRLPPIL